MKVLLFGVLILISPILSWAQEKPTRDVSKDISREQSSNKKSFVLNEFNKKVVGTENNKGEVKSSKPKGATVKHTKSKRSAKKQKSNRRSFVPQPQLPTYLSVNGLEVGTIFSDIDFSGGELTYIVNSNVAWEYRALPSWCEYKGRIGNTIRIGVNKNANTAHRQGFFYILAGNRETAIYINQKGRPKADVRFFSVLEHNRKNINGVHTEKSLCLSAKVSLSGAVGRNCYVRTYVDDRVNYLPCSPSYYNRYSVDWGQGKVVSAMSSVIQCAYDNTLCDFTFILPNDAILLFQKEAELRLKLYVYIEGDSSPINESVPIIIIKAKRKRKGVITSNPW